MEDLKTLKKMVYRIYHILDRRQRRQMVGIFIIMMVGSLAELLSVSSILPFMESIMTPDMLKDKWYISFLVRIFGIKDNVHLIILSGLLVVLMYLLKNVYLLWSSYMQVRFTNTMQKALSLKMYHCYMNRPYEFFVSATSGEILRGLNGDASSVYTVIQNFFYFISQIMTICAIVVYLFLLNEFMTIGVVVLGLLCFVGIVLSIKKKTSVVGGIARETNMHTNNWSVQSITGMKDIFVFNKREYAEKKYDELYGNSVKANIIFGFIQACPAYIIEAICASGIILLLLAQVLMGVDMNAFIPKLSVFAMGAFRLLPAIAAASGYVSVFIYHRPSIESAYENFENARKYMESIEEMRLDKYDTDHRFSKSIVVDDICWRYSAGKEDVLHHLSITINKGDSIGIIGESGAGKSTFADLILQLYRPQTGHIYMDGIDINTIPDAWNRNLSYVSQVLFLLNGTIRENVAFCEDDADDNMVWDALEKASLKQYVESLPNGLDTVVGERGINFSGGQRQRIAIARALYTDPEILILDEATSALDNETEQAVMDAIERLKGSITLIIIAHRLTTISNCSRVFEIKGGVAVERDVNEFKKYSLSHEDSKS